MSYNAAGVLAHIASDGVEAWDIENPSRKEVLAKMVNAIERWNLSAERNINYRSFEPILGLVRCYETPECQHWAVWALANLTKVSVVDLDCRFESKIIIKKKKQFISGVPTQIFPFG